MDHYFRKYYVDWDQEIEEYLSGNSTMKAFCENKEYTLGAFAYHYYRRRKNCPHPNMEELPVFLPVEIIGRCESVITVNGYDIKITGQTDAEALRTVLKAIGDISWN